MKIEVLNQEVKDTINFDLQRYINNCCRHSSTMFNLRINFLSGNEFEWIVIIINPLNYYLWQNIQEVQAKK